MDIFRKIFGASRQTDAQQAAHHQPPEESSGKPRVAGLPHGDGISAPYSKSSAPALASPPRFQQAGPYATKLPEANRPDAVVASLGDDPAPKLIVRALLFLWSDEDTAESGSMLERFQVACNDMHVALHDAYVEYGERVAAIGECDDSLKSLLEAKLPANCQASYRQALQESARCKNPDAARGVMKKALEAMGRNLRGTPKPSSSATTTTSATTSTTATASTSSTSAGSALIPVFPVLEQLISTEPGRKANGCLNEYQTLAMDSGTNICMVSQAHVELNQKISGEDKWKAVANTRVYSSLPQKTALRIAAERDCRYRRDGEVHDAALNRKLLGCKGNAHVDIPEAHQPGNEVSIALQAPLLVAPQTVVNPVILQWAASRSRLEYLAARSPGDLEKAHRTTLQTLAQHTLQCARDNPGKGVVLTAYGSIDSLKGLSIDQKVRLKEASAEEFAKLVKALHAEGRQVYYAESVANATFWDEVQIKIGARERVRMTNVGTIPNAELDGKIVVVSGSSTSLVGSGWEDEIKSANAAIGMHSLVQTIHAGFCAAINAGMSLEQLQHIDRV